MIMAVTEVFTCTSKLLMEPFAQMRVKANIECTRKFTFFVVYKAERQRNYKPHACSFISGK